MLQLRTSVFALILMASVSFSGTWVAVTGNLQAANINKVAAVPNTDRVIAGLHCQGAWATANAGTSWAKLGGSAAATMTHIVMNLLFDPSDPNTFWSVGIYGGADCSGWGPGVFRTTDGGTSFAAVGGLSHNDGISVDFSDPQRLTVVATGHEGHQALWKSSNGGNSFVDIGPNFPAGTAFSTGVCVINSQTYIVSAAGMWGGGTQGIYRTTDGGSSWTSVSTLDAAAPIVRVGSGAMFAMKVYSDGLLKGSSDGTSWALNSSTIKSVPVEIPNGRLAAVTATDVVASADNGATWTTIVPSLPAGGASGVTYNSVGGAFYAYKGGAGIWRYDTMLQAGLNIYALQCAPISVTNDISTPISISVHAATSSGTVSSVTVDCTPIGGGAAVALTRQTGDLYTCTYTVPSGIAVGTKTLTALVTDNSSATKTTTGALVIRAASGPLRYTSLYADTSTIKAGFSWESNGAGTTAGVSGTEVSTGAFEGTKCLDFQFVCANWWAGFGAVFDNSNTIVNATGYDSIGFYYKANSDCNFELTLGISATAFTDAAKLTYGGSGGWVRAVVPLTFYTSANYEVDSLYGFKVGIKASSASTPSGHLYLDNIFLVGSGNPSSVMRPNERTLQARPQNAFVSPACVFDIAGRKVSAHATSRGSSGSRVNIVRMSNGVVVKRLIR